MSGDGLFEKITPLPDADIDRRAQRLVGFQGRFDLLHNDIRLLIAPDEATAWSKRHHRRVLPVVEILEDRYPLVLFHGDVGTGKTATAEGMASKLAKQLAREATLYKLSTRVRGTGLHGEMSKLVGEAFDKIEAEIGKKRLGILLIDEADALASSRGTVQSHQEEKAGTNTLIQRLDDARKHQGRLFIFLCTNRLNAVDPAVVRRAARLCEFARPTAAEREELLRRDLADLDLTDEQFLDLVHATGPSPKHGHTLGLTFSDIRTRLMPAAVLLAFPDHPLTFDLLLAAARGTPPSPALEAV